MKKYITLLLLIAAIGVKAQTKVTSKELGDQIIIMPGAFEITHTATPTGDTIRSMSWRARSMSRDTLAGFIADVTLYDRNGAEIQTFFQFIPSGAFTRWALFLNKIDAYILNQRRRLVKQ